MTPEQRALRSRIAGSSRYAKHGNAELSKAGVDGHMRRFEQQVDPEGTLPVEERRKRAEAARRVHMSQLSAKAAKARAAKRAS